MQGDLWVRRRLAAAWAARGPGAAVAALVLGALVAAPSGGFCGGGDDGGSWTGYNQNNASPTGTYLSPQDDPGGQGYEVLDEACEDVLDPDYLSRFETPMFRGVAVDQGVAHLTDGSLLWSVDLRDPAQPQRLSVRRLPGHPLRIAVGARGRLFVAAGEAGLHLLQAEDATAMAAARDAEDATDVAPELVSTLPLPAPALDVKTLDATRFVVAAAGLGGLVVVDASDLAAPTVVAHVSLPGFATAVTVDGTVAWVAACRALVAVDVSDPFAPRVVQAYGVPFGHARGVAAAEGDVYVAGGEALFVYDGADPSGVIWTGYYAEPDVPGFYVNDVVARGNVLYLAAGDEAVRSVNVRYLSAAEGFAAEPFESDGPPGLEEPAALPDAEHRPRETITIGALFFDPVAVGLVKDLLLVLGNFRWMGERTLEVVRLDEQGGMQDLGAYVQPNRWRGASALGEHLVLHEDDGLEQVITAGDASPLTFALDAPVQRAVSTSEAVWLLTEDGEVVRWAPGVAAPVPVTEYGQRAFDLAVTADGGTVFYSELTHNRIWAVPDPVSGLPVRVVSLPEATFPGYADLAVHDGTLYAYEGVTGLLHVAAGRPTRTTPVAIPVGRCEAYDLADFFSGQRESRARLVVSGDTLTLLCPEDEAGRSTLVAVKLRRPSDPVVVARQALPRGRYVDVALRDDAAYLLTFDNNRYVSSLLRLVDGALVSGVSFDGHANELLWYQGRWLVIDGDAGVRGFTVSAQGALEPRGLIALPSAEGRAEP